MEFLAALLATAAADCLSRCDHQAQCDGNNNNVIHSPTRSRTLWVLKRVPDRLAYSIETRPADSQLQRGQRRLDERLLLLWVVHLVPTAGVEAVERDAEEPEFLLERFAAVVVREVQSACAVVVEDMAEDARVPVEHVLAGLLVQE